LTVKCYVCNKRKAVKEIGSKYTTDNGGLVSASGKVCSNRYCVAHAVAHFVKDVKGDFFVRRLEFEMPERIVFS